MHFLFSVDIQDAILVITKVRLIKIRAGNRIAIIGNQYGHGRVHGR